MRRISKFAAGAVAAVATAVWWRQSTSASSDGQRYQVEDPHRFIPLELLREALQPRPGETVLEVGPGTGSYTLAVAQWLAPDGALHIFDSQREMLDHTMRRAREAGIRNLAARHGDARELPYADAMFDAAYLVTALDETTEQDAARRELARVLRPGGRLVVGELFGDPHLVTTGALSTRAQVAGLQFERRVGPPFGYFGVLVRPATRTATPVRHEGVAGAPCHTGGPTALCRWSTHCRRAGESTGRPGRYRLA